MNDVKLLHTPQWHLCGADWHMIVGNRSVATIIPNFDRRSPRFRWLSILDDEYICPGTDPTFHSWHAVDFETLEIAKYDIEQWWEHMCRGVEYTPLCDALCPCEFHK